MKSLLMILFFGLFSLECYAQEVVSTEKGGDWNNSKTWLKGKIPDANSNVVINGNVIVSKPFMCKNLKILKTGTLELINTQDSLIAKVTETLNIDDGKLIINDTWKLLTKNINYTDAAKIENSGIIEVGM